MAEKQERSFSYLVAMRRYCFSRAKRFSMRWRRYKRALEGRETLQLCLRGMEQVPPVCRTLCRMLSASKPLSGNPGATPQKTNVELDRVNIAVLATVQAQRKWTAEAVDQDGQLGVQAAFRAANRLRGLSARRIGPVLV